MQVEGVTITPLPVEHGKDYTCIGYEFGQPESRVIYLSDVSYIPEKTLDYILSKPTHLLVLDALRLPPFPYIMLTRTQCSYHSYPTHLSFPDSIKYAKQVSNTNHCNTKRGGSVFTQHIHR